jgi:hypothetical protein
LGRILLAFSSSLLERSYSTQLSLIQRKSQLTEFLNFVIRHNQTYWGTSFGNIVRVDSNAFNAPVDVQFINCTSFGCAVTLLFSAATMSLNSSFGDTA